MPDLNIFGAMSQLVSFPVAGDFVDSLNSKVTPLIFINLATLLAIKQFIFKPIQCWVPAEYTGPWEEYVENYCWIQNTYYLPQNESIPEDTARRTHNQVNYYQWVPFILLLQALLFTLPYLLWNGLCTVTGVNIHVILKMSGQCVSGDVRIREKVGEALADHFDTSLQLNHTQYLRPSLFQLYIKPHFIVGLYVTTKVLSVVNAIGELFLLDGLLGTRNIFYGIHVLWDLAQGRDWQVSGIFPRVTLCDFYKRVVANIHLQTVQCVLPANMLHEKVFLLVWWWLMVMCVVNSASTIVCLMDMLSSRTCTFVYSVLEHSSKPSKSQPFESFVMDHLGRDGVIILRFIFINEGAVVVSDLVTTLWKRFQSKINAGFKQVKPLDKSPPRKRSLGPKFDFQEFEV